MGLSLEQKELEEEKGGKQRQVRSRQRHQMEMAAFTGQSIPQSMPWASEMGQAAQLAGGWGGGGQTLQPGASLRTGCVHLALTNPHELGEVGLLTAAQAGVFASPARGRDGSLDSTTPSKEAGWPGSQHHCPQSYSEQRRERACNNWLLHYDFIMMRDD